MTYGENSNRIRVELTVLLRQHRIQHRLGGRGPHTLPETIEQRREMGELIQSCRLFKDELGVWKRATH